MRFLAFAALFAIAGLALVRATPSAPTSDEAAIEAVVERAYVDGLFRKRDPDLVREGFAPTFVMQVYWDGELSNRTLDAWLAKMKLDRVPSEKKTRGEVTVLEVTGAAAVARIDIHQDDVHKYTDYFGLYRTEEGWKIVSKHFHAHR